MLSRVVGGSKTRHYGALADQRSPESKASRWQLETERSNSRTSYSSAHRYRLKVRPSSVSERSAVPCGRGMSCCCSEYSNAQFREMGAMIIILAFFFLTLRSSAGLQRQASNISINPFRERKIKAQDEWVRRVQGLGRESPLLFYIGSLIWPRVDVSGRPASAGSAETGFPSNAAGLFIGSDRDCKPIRRCSVVVKAAKPLAAVPWN